MLALRQLPWGKSTFVSQITMMMLLICALIILQSTPIHAQQWTGPDGNGNISNTNTGKVGIGTMSPLGRMQVVTTNDDNAPVLAWDGRHFVVGADGNSGGIVLSYNQTNGYGVISALSPSLAWRNIAIAPNAGNVGIGTTSPGALLDLASTTQFTNRLLLSGQEYFAAGNSSSSGVALRIGVNRSGERQLWFADSAQAINATNAQLRMRFFSSSASLDAVSTDGTNTLPLVLQSVGGNVGIGTTNPSTKLQVAGGTRVDGTYGRLYLGTGAVTGARGLEIIEENATTFSIRHHDPNVAWQNIALNPHGGSVGIGTPAPNSQYKLDVNGNVNVTGNINLTGNINAKYQDVAEWVESSQALPAGTVVVLDHTRSNQVISSTQAYDTRVAGVISVQPGIALGESGAGKVLVATTGRVRMKVDAGRAPIGIGDLLVTGDTPGMAMKSEPIKIGGRLMHMPGTLIGKALEPLAKGTGKILVLLSLQ